MVPSRKSQLPINADKNERHRVSRRPHNLPDFVKNKRITDWEEVRRMRIRIRNSKTAVAAAGICLAICFSMLLSITGSADQTLEPDVSDTPAVTFSVCGIKGMPMTFSAKGMEQQLGVPDGSLAGIVLTELPDAKQGTLTISGEAVSLYQTISRDGVDALAFTPAKGCAGASFNFVPLVPDEDTPTAKMTIALLDKANVAPTAAGDVIATQENINIAGVLDVTDENLPSVTIEIVDSPQKGDVVLSGQKYTYEPYLGMTGHDSFTYRAVDKYGCASQTAKVDITINTPQTSLTYADMSGNTDYYAALKLAQQGILVGEQIGSNHYFLPAETVSCGDFLEMLLAVTGLDANETPTVNTGLQNDTSIPLWLKPAVDEARRDGVIGGKIFVSTFDYAQPVTRTQAVYMMENAARIPNVTRSQQVLEDAAALPAWAVQPYINLTGNKILTADETGANPSGKLTRAEAAGMLWNLVQYCSAHSDDLAGDE